MDDIQVRALDDNRIELVVPFSPITTDARDLIHVITKVILEWRVANGFCSPPDKGTST